MISQPPVLQPPNSGGPFGKPWVDWLSALYRSLAPAISLPSYEVGKVPDPAKCTGSIIYVSNESGGAVPAFSDGTNWRRATDRAIIS